MSTAAVYARRTRCGPPATDMPEYDPGPAPGLAGHHRGPGVAGTVTADRFDGDHAR